MTTLDDLARACGGRAVGPDRSVAGVGPIIDATHDSRQVEPGWLYCCVRGSVVDGHRFAPAAVAAGSPALLVDHELDLDVPQVVVGDVRPAMALAAAEIHRHPSRDLTVIGVTGTNGKSSIVRLLSDLYDQAGITSAIIGTLQGPRTTPESTDLQRMLARFVSGGIEMVAMEVSSHALELFRVAGTSFAAGIFTNLGHDHLDFHHTMEAYFEAKARLFDPAYTALGVINADDPYGRRLIERAPVAITPYALDDAASIDYRGPVTAFEWRGRSILLQLAGAHNVSNALAAATAAVELGLDLDTVVAGLERTRPVRGRFEMVDEGQPFLVAVDYAHTPDALQAALIAARQAAGDNRILLVFGCGGDRDVQKRPEMGQVAEKGADVVVVTSDNPRSEEPKSIVDDILRGFERSTPVVELDRRSAIATALDQARPGDVVVIAGKGHETRQIIGDATFDFDDRQVAIELLGERV